ncbi:MAG: HEAT repeat domain-containing protein, partial [Phormidesmis sp. CAN_BIN44]|nr:HEAT repeat domain-containing protein [Phormidesmis sp. CAN_BIN44]
IWELIQTSLENCNLYLEVSDIKKLVEHRRLLLLADGFNELPSDRARTEFKKFCGRKIPVIVTSRDGTDDLGLERKLQIQPLTNAKVKAFLQSRLPGYAQAQIKKLGDRVKDFGQTPLMVWMLFSIFRQNGDIPNTRGEAYRAFTTLYAGRAKEGIDLDESRGLLSKLAFELMHSDKPTDFRLDISEVDAQNLVGPEKALKHLVRNHLLQAKGKPGNCRISFCHQSLQEYYAAEALLVMLRDKHPDVMDDQRLQYFYLNYLKWTETISIALSLMEDEEIAVKIVRSALKVDWLLGARLAGEVRSEESQKKTIVLVKALGVPEWVRVELLGKTRSKLALPSLIEFLRHPDIHITRTAAAYIGDTGNALAIQILLKRLEGVDVKFFSQESFGGSDQTGDIWTKNIQALAYVAPQKAIQFLRGKLSPNGGFNTVITMVTRAPQLLMRLDSEEMLPCLVNCLRRTQNQVRKNEISNLISAAKDYEAILPDLIDILKHEEDEDIQAAIGGLITESNSDLAIQTSVWMMSHHNAKLREKAIHHLIKNKISQIEDLEHLLTQKEDNPDLAFSVAVVLGSLGYEVALPFLVETLISHLSFSVRIRAAKSLGSINNHRAITYLLEGLNDPNVFVRREVAFSLASLERPEAIPILMDCFTAGYLDAHTYAVRSLAKLKVEEPLWSKIENKTSGWQTAAVELVKLGRPKAISSLCDTLVEPEGESSSEVIDLLSEFADDSVVDWLLNALENPSQHTLEHYFPNRVALVLNRCQPDLTAGKLSKLISLSVTRQIEQLSWLIPTIQNQCKYYSYAIAQWELAPHTTERSSSITIQGDCIAGDKIEGDKNITDRSGILNTGNVTIHGDQNGETFNL